MRGVILAGGKGTRMAPCTNVTNKHLLPVYSPEGAVPMLFYPIRTLVSSGIHDILIVSSREHCGHIIETLSDGYNFEADFSYKIQDCSRVQMGIASALKLTRNFTNGETFAVILGDNYFEDAFQVQFAGFESLDPECAVIESMGPEPFGWGETETAGVFVKEVDDPERFGVISGDESGWRIEEKPKQPESNLAVTGMYLYTPHVYEVADTLKPSARNELEITDINNYYCNNNRIQVHTVKGFWSDMGTVSSMLRTQQFLENNKQISR